MVLSEDLLRHERDGYTDAQSADGMARVPVTLLY